MPTSILFAVSECASFIKAGGLGDVAAALPVALRALGHDVRVVLPRYDAISLDGLVRRPAPLGVPLGGGEAWAAVYETTLPGTDVPVYLLDHHGLFGRGYLYDPPGGHAHDNLIRFAFLSRGALQLARSLHWIPDVIHVHDWPTALVPVYLNTLEGPHTGSPLARTATVMTIHNLAYQPRFAAADLAATHIPLGELRPDSLEDYGGVSPFKGGLFHATMLTTVSPRYATEIRTPEGGAGLDHIMRFRGGDLLGILNGIDEAVWDPRTDRHLAARFGADDMAGKATCKRALQREFGLAERDDVPLIGMITRLTEQKGVDVVLAALDRLLALDVQLVILGSGERNMEWYLATRSHHGGDRFRAWLGFNEKLSHRIEAAADLFLMPSRFEPCGLNQMYSQRYGALPIVRATGGLDDTVDQYDPGTGAGTGFKFWDLTEDALVGTVGWAVETWRDRRDHFVEMQRRAMGKHFGWSGAARRYAEVYQWALERRRRWVG